MMRELSEASNRITPVQHYWRFHVWHEELDTFFAIVRLHHPGLWRWLQTNSRSLLNVKPMHSCPVFWAEYDETMAGYFTAAIAELDSHRIDRGDGRRILPTIAVDGEYFYGIAPKAK